MDHFFFNSQQISSQLKYRGNLKIFIIFLFPHYLITYQESISSQNSFQNSSQHSSQENSQHYQRGQTFIEFMLVFMVVFILSLTFLRVSNNGMARRWKLMVDTLGKPEVVEFR